VTADDRRFGRNAAQGIIAERAAGVFFGYNTSLAAGDVFVVERDGAGTVQAARFDVPAEKETVGAQRFASPPNQREFGIVFSL